MEDEIKIPTEVFKSMQSDDGYFEVFWQLHKHNGTLISTFHDLESRRFACGVQPRFSSFQSFQTCLYRRIKNRRRQKPNKV